MMNAFAHFGGFNQDREAVIQMHLSSPRLLNRNAFKRSDSGV